MGDLTTVRNNIGELRKEKQHANAEKVMQVARNEMNEERAPLRDAADVRMGQEGKTKRLTTCNLIPSHMSIDGSNDWIY